MTNEILIAALLLIVGAVTGYTVAALLFRPKMNNLQKKVEEQHVSAEKLALETKELNHERNQLQNQLVRVETLYSQLKQQADQLHSNVTELQHEKGRLTEEKATQYAQLKHYREKLDNQQNDILRLREQFRLEFSELAQKILDENSRKFSESNEERIRQILEPLKTNITEFKQKVEETYDKESKERFSLGREVQRLLQMSAQVSQDANNLSLALKGNNKMQGNWGEMILESLLENSGLTPGREYLVQEFIRDGSGNIVKDEAGKSLQPDVMIRYPDNRRVIIDSKVSLVAWEQCINCNEPADQTGFLQQHICSVRQHIDGLSRKNYPRYAAAIDYVLLFIPIEPAFLEAIKTDTQLWKYAYEKKILLVSPTNLFAVLKIIADLWKVEKQNNHAIQIAEKAGKLYDKFTGLVENLELVGKKLEDATVAYTEAFKQLTTGRGNVIKSIEDLKKMGAAASKQLPERLLAQSGENE